MAKIKCWKKTRVNEKLIRFDNIKRTKTIGITKISPKLYSSDIVSNDGMWKSKSFKSKTGAISFSKAYMKKHDKC